MGERLLLYLTRGDELDALVKESLVDDKNYTWDVIQVSFANRKKETLPVEEVLFRSDIVDVNLLKKYVDCKDSQVPMDLIVVTVVVEEDERSTSVAGKVPSCPLQTGKMVRDVKINDAPTEKQKQVNELLQSFAMTLIDKSGLTDLNFP